MKEIFLIIMNLKEKLELIKTKMFDLISVSEITFLKEMDKRIYINKFGKFFYLNLDSTYNQIWRFLIRLDAKKVYIVIPMLSKNNRPDQPYIILSEQILITNESNAFIIAKFIGDKIDEVIELYGINDPDNLNLIFKYKQVEVNFKEHSKF